MRLPLYLRIWLAVIGAVLVITLAFAWLWRANDDEAPSGLRGREREIILRDFDGVPEADVRDICCNRAKEFFRLD